MKIIPVINCNDFECVKARYQDVVRLYDGAAGDHWVHIDIADGSFTGGYATWRSPEELSQLTKQKQLKIELHVMVKNPEEILESWFSAGIGRAVVHLESTTNIEAVKSMCDGAGVEFMLALSPETPVSHAAPYLAGIQSCQLLAVKPGLAGQQFNMQIPEKIRALREQFPNLVIEVDGGITPQTGLNCKRAGADLACSASYLWNSDDPKRAFDELSSLGA